MPTMELRHERYERHAAAAHDRLSFGAGGTGRLYPHLREVERRSAERHQRMLTLQAAKREAVQTAVLSMLFGKASLYEDYGDCNYEARVDGSLLSRGEFESVVAAVYAASDVVLEEHFKKSREVVDSWYDSMHRQAAGSEYREYWPLGGHEDWLTRVMEIDAAWCTPGYTAPHAIITLLDRLTGCIVGACHVSKEVDTAGLARPGRAILGHSKSSGDMDRAGSEEVLRDVAEHWPFRRLYVVKDGDVKGGHVREVEGCENYDEGGCHCHVAKNVRKGLTSKSMTGAPCPGGCLDRDQPKQKCGSQKGARCTKGFANKFYARFYEVLRQAELMIFPELGVEHAPLPNDVGSPEREASRQKAIEWATQQLYAALKHFTGDHSHCDHGELPANHPTFKCRAQINVFSEEVTRLVKKLPLILTPFGLLDINRVESNHAVFRLFRPKGRKYSALYEFTAVNMGILNCSQLCLGFWGEKTQPIVRIVELLNERHGLTIELSEAQLAYLDLDLKVRIKGREKRSSEHWQQVRRAYVARKRTSQASQANQCSYMGGGGEGARAADLALAAAAGAAAAANEIAWLGGRSIGILSEAEAQQAEAGHEEQDEDANESGEESGGE